ncbi:MAG: DUF3276 family protein [Pirellulaceae bacterium]
MSAESRKELFTRRVSAGSRTYFFDVKQSAEGAKYLVISESREVDGKWEHDRVMVFEEHLQPFLTALQAAGIFLCAKVGSGSGFEEDCERQVKESLPGEKPKAYSLDDIRQTHHRAYRPWTEEEDKMLLARFEADCPIGDLAAFFEREEGAIRSRLKKLRGRNSLDDRPQWKKERPNSGKTWSNKDDAELLAAFDSGMPIPRIARALGRGLGAVQVRLIKLGRETPCDGEEYEPF